MAEYENKTGTELKILQSIEKSFYNANGSDTRRNTEKSMEWFRKNVTKNYNTARTSQMFLDRDLFKNKMVLGKMYFYEYDALHKDKLPYWDRYPIIIPFSAYKAKNGASIVLGINFHYLPPKLRMIAFRSLLEFRSAKAYNNKVKMKITWNKLMSLGKSKYFEHAVKAYRMDRVRSKFVEIPAQSWELSIFLPISRFQKSNKKTVWKM